MAGFSENYDSTTINNLNENIPTIPTLSLLHRLLLYYFSLVYVSVLYTLFCHHPQVFLCGRIIREIKKEKKLHIKDTYWTGRGPADH